MDNTEKLIRAWLKCEGYEIEETVTKKPFNTGMGNPEIIETIKLIDYKVTKKDNTSMWFPSDTEQLLKSKHAFGESILQ